MTFDKCTLVTSAEEISLWTMVDYVLLKPLKNSYFNNGSKISVDTYVSKLGGLSLRQMPYIKPIKSIIYTNKNLLDIVIYH